jgi:outer membrane protein, heavy metal efflux system
MSRKMLAVCFLLLWAGIGRMVPADVSAGDVALAPSLKSLEAALLERSPTLAAREELTHASGAAVGPASALPDPMFEFMLQDVGFPDMTIGDAEMSMASFEVRQNLLFPGKRKARRNAALAEVQVRSLERERVRRKLLTKLRVLYARLYATDRESRSLQAARELLGVLNETVAMRYRVGETDQEAVLKVQLQGFRILERLESVQARRKGLAAGLNGLLDLPADAPFGEVADLPPAALPPDALEHWAVSASPEVLVRTAELDTAEKQLHAARMEAWPNLSLGGGAGYREKLDPLAIFRLGVEIPFWRKSKVQATISMREHERQAAHQNLRESQAMARAELSRSLARMEGASNQVKLYEEAILPQSSAALDAARASYAAGQGTFSTVIEDFDLWLEARIRLAQRQAEAFIAWAGVCYLADLKAGGQKEAGGALQEGGRETEGETKGDANDSGNRGSKTGRVGKTD